MPRGSLAHRKSAVRYASKCINAAVFGFNRLIRRAGVRVDLFEKVRALTGGKADVDARILLQSLDNWRDCRIVHRGAAINQDLPFFTTTTSLPTFVQATEPLDGVTGDSYTGISHRVDLREDLFSGPAIVFGEIDLDPGIIFGADRVQWKPRRKLAKRARRPVSSLPARNQRVHFLYQASRAVCAKLNYTDILAVSFGGIHIFSNIDHEIRR